MGIINIFKQQIMNPINYAKTIGVDIGKNCEFHKNIMWGSEPYLIKIGNNVRITNGVRFCTHDGGVWVLRNLKKEYTNIDIFGKIVVGNNVHIGWNAIIMPGVTIGDNCIIGAGAIVTKDIDSNSIAVGIPAKVIKNIQDYEIKNKTSFMYTKQMSYKKKRNFLDKNLK